MKFVRSSYVPSFALFLLCQVACSGGNGSSASTGDGGRGGEGDQGGAAGEIPGGAELPQAAVDPGFVGIHRLNNTEYENTVKDLLGVSGTPAGSFAPDEQALGFDNIASALGMTPSQYEQYFDSGRSLADDVWKSPSLKGRVLVCSDDSDECKTRIASEFGLRAWRRPLQKDEVDGLLDILKSARSAGEDFEGSVRQLVATVLASPQFLYRIERDKTDKAHRLDGYETASRLSYALWTTMPDAALFTSAEKGELSTDAGIKSQLDRMLSDSRSARFVDGFAGQWLGIRSLKSHQVDPTIFPEWDEDLRKAMVEEATLYFKHFLDDKGASAAEFFTSRLNFVNARLAKHYGLDAGKYGNDATTLKDGFTDRKGFLGLGAFLTERSFLHRTSPTARGVWIVKNLLCDTIPAPPQMVPELDQNQTVDASAIANVRDRLAAHRSNPQCSGCHALFDPVGLGLEKFDAIGRKREKYANGDAIDTSGELPDGTKFNGLVELADILSKDPRFAQCMAQKLFVYSLGRDVADGDAPSLEQLGKVFAAANFNVRDLVKGMILSESFRSRRSER